MDLLLFLVVLALVATWVSAPLRRPVQAATGPDPSLLAERDARLAAVRDAELDARMGKLSADEHRAVDAELRQEALEAMRRAQESS